MVDYFKVGCCTLRIKSDPYMDFSISQLGKFRVKSNKADYTISCKLISNEEFNYYTRTVGQNKQNSYNYVYFCHKDRILVEKRFSDRKITISYALPEIVRGGMIYDVKALIWANMKIVIAQMLIYDGYLLLHGAGLIRNQVVLVFLASDGGGKTTLIRHNTGHSILNDDQVFFAFSHKNSIVYSTPFGTISHGQISAPLGAFFFIIKSKNFSIQRIENQELLRSLWQDNHEVYNVLPQNMKKRLFHLLSNLAFSAPLFALNTYYGEIDWDQVDKVLKNT